MKGSNNNIKIIEEGRKNMNDQYKKIRNMARRSIIATAGITGVVNEGKNIGDAIHHDHESGGSDTLILNPSVPKSLFSSVDSSASKSLFSPVDDN